MSNARAGPAPWVFGLLILPLGISVGFKFTRLPFLLAQVGVPVYRIATIASIIHLPAALVFLWASPPQICGRGLDECCWGACPNYRKPPIHLPRGHGFVSAHQRFCLGSVRCTFGGSGWSGDPRPKHLLQRSQCGRRDTSSFYDLARRPWL